MTPAPTPAPARYVTLAANIPLWRIAQSTFAAAGAPDYSAYAEAIRAANLTIHDWRRLSAGTIIVLPGRSA